MSSTDQSNQDSRHDSDQINITSLKSEIDDLADNEAAQKQSFDVHKIDADLMQIDSILKALNSGTFDEGNMATIEQLTSIRPQVLHWYIYSTLCKHISVRYIYITYFSENTISVVMYIKQASTMSSYDFCKHFTDTCQDPPQLIPMSLNMDTCNYAYIQHVYAH